MAKIKVLAGDFAVASADWKNRTFYFHSDNGAQFAVAGSELTAAEVATEDNIKRIKVGAAAGLAGATVGWLLLGPLGIVGLAATGGMLALRGKDVTFIAEFRDGRKLLGTVEARAFKEMQAYSMFAGKGPTMVGPSTDVSASDAPAQSVCPFCSAAVPTGVMGCPNCQRPFWPSDPARAEP